MSNDTLVRAISAYRNAAAIQPPAGPAPQNMLKPPVSSGDSAAETFAGLVNASLNATRGKLEKSEKLSAQALVKNAPLHEVVTAVTEAEMALQTIVAIRDRVINAYQDIIKMPI